MRGPSNTRQGLRRARAPVTKASKILGAAPILARLATWTLQDASNGRSGSDIDSMKSRLQAACFDSSSPATSKRDSPHRASSWWQMLSSNATSGHGSRPIRFATSSAAAAWRSRNGSLRRRAHASTSSALDCATSTSSAMCSGARGAGRLRASGGGVPSTGANLRKAHGANEWAPRRAQTTPAHA